MLIYFFHIILSIRRILSIFPSKRTCFNYMIFISTRITNINSYLMFPGITIMSNWLPQFPFACLSFIPKAYFVTITQCISIINISKFGLWEKQLFIKKEKYSHIYSKRKIESFSINNRIMSWDIFLFDWFFFGFFINNCNCPMNFVCMIFFIIEFE